MPDGQNFPSARPQLLRSSPGVRRDGTRLASNNYMAAEWCRFYQDLPRKMLGYREKRRDLEGIVRGMDAESYDGYSYIHLGAQSTLQRTAINLKTGLTTSPLDRTPAGFAADPDNNWQFSLIYNTASNANVMLVHAAPNIGDISDSREQPIYYGEVRDSAAFIPITGSNMSGGVVALWPYAMRYGNDGEVAWNVAGDITNLTGTGSGSARPWGTKVVRGLPLRGTSGPAALFWHLDALTRAQFVGGTTLFNFDTLTTSTAILSSNGVIEHAGIYYWATVSGFQMFNGVVRDIPNDSNRQFWIDNLNWDMRQKVFAFKIPRWNEIWFCGPLFGATECNWAVILNYVTGYWYDTPLPTTGGGYSAGVYEQIYHYPLICSPQLNGETGGSSLWQHDYGFDEISGIQATPKAIRSLYQTHEFNTVDPQQPGQLGVNQTMSFSLIEPDFNQRGDLMIYLLGRANARATTRRKGPLLVPAVPTGKQQIAKTKFTGRYTSFVVLSNTLGGYYETGDVLFHWQPGDARTEDGGDQDTVVDETPLLPDNTAVLRELAK
jgi:hypothetical protein